MSQAKIKARAVAQGVRTYMQGQAVWVIVPFRIVSGADVNSVVVYRGKLAHHETEDLLTMCGTEGPGFKGVDRNVVCLTVGPNRSVQSVAKKEVFWQA